MTDDDRRSGPPGADGHDASGGDHDPAFRSEGIDGDPGDEIDPGEPISSLRDLALSPRPEFFARVRGTIDRRVLFSDLAMFGSEAFGYATIEHLAMFFHFLRLPIPGEDLQEHPRNDHGDGDGTDQG